MTEFKAGYLHTSFGYLWSLARPLMLFGVLLVVFTKIFRIGSEVPNYPAMLLFNIMLFTFFQEATTNAVTSVVDQENVVRKMQFPRIVIPLSIVLTAAFNLCLNMIAVFVFILIYGVEPTWTWLGLPLILAALVVFTTARLDAALGALRALPRRRDHLVGRRPDPLLREPDPLSDARSSANGELRS